MSEKIEKEIEEVVQQILDKLDSMIDRFDRIDLRFDEIFESLNRFEDGQSKVISMLKQMNQKLDSVRGKLADE